MKRLLALLLVLCMLFSLVACSAEDDDDRRDRSKSSSSKKDDDDDDDDDDVDDDDDNSVIIEPGLPYEIDDSGRVLDDYFEGVEIEWWFSSYYGLSSNMYLFKAIEEAIGCKIKVVSYDSETYRVKVNTALQANNLPNMCAMLVEFPVYNIYGDLGAFVNLLDESTQLRMPNFVNKILNNADIAEQLDAYKSEAGGLYSMVRYDYERTVNFGWMYREDIFEKHGIEMWHDSESFLEVARQLKQLYPESYPVGGASMQDVFNRVCNSYGFNSTTKAYDWDTNTWYLGATDEGFYEMLSLYQTLWNEGLLDPDCFTNGTNHLDEGMFNNMSFIFNSWIGRMSFENTYAQYSPDMVDPNFHVAYAPQIGNGLGQELHQLSLTNTVINAKANQKQVEACIAIYNFLYSDIGTQIMTMGEEGITYEIIGGEYVYRNRDGSLMANPTIQILEEQYGLWNGSTYVLVDRNSPYFTYTEEEAEAQIIGTQNGVCKAVPPVTVAQDKANRYDDLSVQLENEIKQYCQNFIKNGYTKQEWQAQCLQWQQKYSELFTILNAAN